MKITCISFILILGLSQNIYSQKHLIQLDLNELYKFYNNELDSLHKNYQNKMTLIPNITYTYINKNKNTHSIRLGYYNIKNKSESFNFYPNLYYQFNAEYKINTFSIGYAFGNIYKQNNFIFHSQIISDFKIKSKYLEHNTQRIVDSSNNINRLYTDNIYFPKQNIVSIYLKETISRKLFNKLYLGLGIGYGVEYSKYIGDRIITSNGPNVTPYLVVKNDGYYLIQMNFFPSLSLLYNIDKK